MRKVEYDIKLIETRRNQGKTIPEIAVELKTDERAFRAWYNRNIQTTYVLKWKRIGGRSSRHD